MRVVNDLGNAAVSDGKRVQQLVVGEIVLDPAALDAQGAVLENMIFQGFLGDGRDHKDTTRAQNRAAGTRRAVPMRVYEVGGVSDAELDSAEAHKRAEIRGELQSKVIAEM